MLECGGPTRWIIDFAQRDLLTAMKYKIPFQWVKEKVMPVVMDRVLNKKKKPKVKKSHVTRESRNAGGSFQDDYN